jgi:DNA-binding NarL/FixJ family response regulator
MQSRRLRAGRRPRERKLGERMSAGHDPIRILTVDDHPLFRNGVAALLATQPDMEVVAEASYQLAEHATDEALTPAEVDVLRLIAGGNANKEIAAQLSVTEETVKGRVKNILSKLGANDRTHAAMIGVRRGIIEAKDLNE